MRNRLFAATAAAPAVAFLFAASGDASAYTLSTLHTFCNESDCGDGKTPYAGLLMDASGKLYGTTYEGGKYGYGNVFVLTPNADKSKYTEHILKNFCADPDCTDGGHPYGDLIFDADGNLYGTTFVGGKFAGGTVFKMTHKTNGWSVSAIYAFCGDANCADGSGPTTGLSYPGQASGAPWDGTSPLFGTTYLGGANAKGVAYELSPNGSGWTYKVVHNFNAPDANTSADPGPLFIDPSGNLFGVTSFGGKYGYGVLFKLAAGTWKETTLHNFCAQANCADGLYGVGRLAMDAAGNLFGTAEEGGKNGGVGSGGGVFEHPAGGGYQVIYDFCAASRCRDGEFPQAGVIIAANGTLYGTAGNGGKGDNGTVFALSYDSGSQQWTESVLHRFCHRRKCTAGEYPYAPVILDQSGNLFGTTITLGANGDGGTVFELTP